jgi:hypothetical protein
MHRTSLWTAGGVLQGCNSIAHLSSGQAARAPRLLGVVGSAKLLGNIFGWHQVFCHVVGDGRLLLVATLPRTRTGGPNIAAFVRAILVRLRSVARPGREQIVTLCSRCTSVRPQADYGVVAFIACPAQAGAVSANTPVLGAGVGSDERLTAARLLADAGPAAAGCLQAASLDTRAGHVAHSEAFHDRLMMQCAR